MAHVTPKEAEARRALAKYGQMKRFSSLEGLPERAGFPVSILMYLRHSQQISGMGLFLTMDMARAMRNLPTMAWNEVILIPAHKVTTSHKLLAMQIWHEARQEVLGITPPLTRKGVINTDYSGQAERNEEMAIDPNYERYTDPTTQNVHVNAERNEMVALLQHAKGAQFVKVHMQHSRLDEYEEKTKAAPRLTYKAVGLELVVGDYVIVQYRERLGIAVVEKVLDDVPTSDEYDYRNQLKHVVQKIDTDRAKQLTALDRKLLKTLTQSEAQSRMERLTRQLGVAMESISLELPDLTED